MRVAHVSDVYLPRTGGIEMQVRGLSQAQFASGRDPQIYTATPARRGQAVIEGETDNGVPIHRLALDLPGGVPVSPTIGAKLAAMLKESDVVHVHGGLISPFAWPALRTAVKAGLPAVVSVHSVWPSHKGVFSAANGMYGWRDWPVIWTTVSEVSAAPMRNAIGPGADVAILPNGIDVDTWRGGLNPAKDPNEFVVVSVARLAIRKRAGALIDILEDARKQLPPEIKLRAVLVGDGPDRSKLERMISSRKMPWVELAGWRTHDQIREIFASADVFVNPTKLESFGIAALEARTFGLPVIARSDSGVTSFIHEGEEGLLAADDKGLASAIVKPASDPALLATIKDNNRTSASAFGWDDVVASADALYEQAIELRNRS